MKLDPKTAERMKRAAIERQAQKAAEASKQPSKRDPGYDAVTRRKLKKAGLDARSEQPASVLEALANIPDAQTERITAMRYQDATGDKHKSGRAAMVQQVHSALNALSLRAQSGLLGYADLWEAAQPCVVMEYGERHRDQRVGQSQEDRDPAWLRNRTKLREFEATLDRRIARHADNFMSTKDTLAINAITLSMLENVGKALANAFEKV
jgi:hypothetical protein